MKVIIRHLTSHPWNDVGVITVAMAVLAFDDGAYWLAALILVAGSVLSAIVRHKAKSYGFLK